MYVTRGAKAGRSFSRYPLLFLNVLLRYTACNYEQDFPLLCRSYFYRHLDFYFADLVRTRQRPKPAPEATYAFVGIYTAGFGCR